MSVIALFGGTTEGRIICDRMKDSGHILHLFVVSEYGAELVYNSKNIIKHVGRLDDSQIEKTLSELHIDICVDATHPYANVATANIYNACQNTGTRYVRIERETQAAEEESTAIQIVEDVSSAVEILKGTTGKILVTTGSKELSAYTAIPDYRDRCIVRVLPSEEALSICKVNGFESKNIIAMQGPFSTEMNYAIMKQYGISYMVTKESGKTGGFLEKLEAAKRAKVMLIVAGRPKEVCDYSERKTVEEFINELSTYEMTFDRTYKSKDENADESEDKSADDSTVNNTLILHIVGIGPGGKAYITPRALECVEKSQVLIGARRMLEAFGRQEAKTLICEYSKEKIADYISDICQRRGNISDICALYSGDIGFYSGAFGLEELLTKYIDKGLIKIDYVPGLSSLQYFMDILGKGWQDTEFISMHGREADITKTVLRSKSVCALLGGEDCLSNACKLLVENGLGEVCVTVGSNLSYENEEIKNGKASEFCDVKIDKLSVALFERN